MSDNWIVQVLNGAFNLWNKYLGEIFDLLSESPQTFKGGSIWNVALQINGALQAIGYSLLILFFAVGIFKSASSLQDFKRPEVALRHFIRFVAAKTAITYGIDLMMAIFKICAGIVTRIGGSLAGVTQQLAMPDDIVTAIESVGFLSSIPLMIVALLGYVLVIVLSFKMILTVYSRFFRLYMYTALASVPLAAFGGEATSGTGKAFIKSYMGVCLEGAIIILACIIYNAYAASSTVELVSPDASAITIVISYLVETVFSLLILVGLVSGADRIVKEMISG